jgi:TatD DNase family protein
MYYDIHCHLTDSKFDADRDEVIARAQEMGVTMITIGTDEITSREAILLAEKYDHVYAIVGYHPDELPSEGISSAQRAELHEMVQHPKVVGIGECGFDFFRKEKTSKLISFQEEAFRTQIELAIEHNKPLMLHNRPTAGTYDTYEESLRVLSSYTLPDSGEGRPLGRGGEGNLRAGDLNIMQRFLDIGFSISFTGVITFAPEYEELVRAVPLDRLFLETDAPYVAPVPYRGQRCEPQYVMEVYKKVAEIRGISIEEVIESQRENVKMFLS